MSDLDYLMGVVERQGQRIGTKPVNRWATVITTVPLTIQLDGDPAPLLGTPASAAPKILMPGERVRVEIQNNRVTVLAAANRVQDMRGTTAQRLALEAAGAVVDGMRFYDTDDALEYVRIGGIWSVPGDAQTWSPAIAGLTVAGGSVVGAYVKRGRVVDLFLDIVWGTGMVATATLAVPLPFPQSGAGVDRHIGTGLIATVSNGAYPLQGRITTGSSNLVFNALNSASSTVAIGNNISNAFPSSTAWTAANMQPKITFVGTYLAAS